MSVEPLEDFETLLNVDLAKALPKAVIAKASPRGCKLSVQRLPGEKFALKRVEKAVPKTLVCHDFKGGYLEDKYLDGASGLSSQPYTFLHWSKIDIFVYFSHKFITIPPVGWIEAGHKNGVKVLGTIITEFDQGVKICNAIFQSKQTMRAFVEKCAAIADHVGFDGYLLNIENPMKGKVHELIELTKELTEMMHKTRPESLVIWYDSVTAEGELEWQNALNDMNAPFFNVCDGIFLNYNWTEEKLANSVLFNSERPHDIFVGIDVFGRGCPGGGGFDSDKALTIINNCGLSSAIFAPGWTHEKAEPGSTGFKERDLKFWLRLEPLLHHQGVEFQNDGFELDINPGCGEKEGRWWLNLRDLSQMPCFQDSSTYELFCDLKLGDCNLPQKIEICASFESQVICKDVHVVLVFDEDSELIIHPWKANGTDVTFMCERNGTAKCLHFVQVQNKGCDGSKLKKLAIRQITAEQI